MRDSESVTGTGEPGGQAKGARDRRGTRPAILGAAQELFAAHGYAGTSVADIAGRLGMSKAALYYHFRSKTEILQALLEEPVAAYSRPPPASSAPGNCSEP
jgi:AcrR family transcriptional regulator